MLAITLLGISFMDEQTLLSCAESFSKLLDISYHIVLGRAGKSIAFNLTFTKYDCHHLMGIHYLLDRPDRRNRARIFDDILTSAEYRQHIATSDFWTDKVTERITCTSIIEQLIDDNHTIFRYNPSRSSFYSQIKAEYLLSNPDVIISSSDQRDIYVFLDKRADSEERFCKSIFPKGLRDYTERQAIWALLYKAKKHISSGQIEVLYQHKSYSPESNETKSSNASTEGDGN